MKVSIRQKLILLSFVVLLCNGFIGYFIYQSNQKLKDAGQWVQHSEQVMYLAGNILSLGKDIETASRGFVITNDSTFLEPLYANEKIIFTYIRQLRQLVQDNPVQQQRVDSLSFYMQKRLDFSFQMIALRSKQGLAAAIAYVSTKQGNKYTALLRQTTSAILQEENNLLTQRKQMNGHRMSLLNWFSFITFIVMTAFTIFILIAASNYLLQNKENRIYAAELIIANKEFVFQNEEKEKRAAELIIANKEIGFQSEEKEKRAEELIIANKELVIQNKEKEKRALELFIAIIEREKAEKELLAKNRELKELYAYQKNVREAERKHMAREVHDELGQLATAIKIDIDWLNIKIRASDESMKIRIAHVNKAIEVLITSIRKVASSLRPSALDDLGLNAALQNHCAEFKELNGIQCSFEPGFDDTGLAMDKKTELYRIAQESLTNVMRHAKASKVMVTTKEDTDSLYLTIADDGKGFDTSERKNTLGLIGLRERAISLHGELLIDSNIGNGTIISAVIPRK